MRIRLLRIFALALPLVVLLGIAYMISPASPLATRFENPRVQCVSQGEVIFDQRFDGAIVNPLGSIIVWLGDLSVVIDSPDCHVVPN